MDQTKQPTGPTWASSPCNAATPSPTTHSGSSLVGPSIESIQTYLISKYPKLQSFMVDRLAKEQLERCRRYMCAKGKLLTSARLQETRLIDSQTGQRPSLSELSGAVSPAVSSNALPLSVDHLPAEFDCTYCFETVELKRLSQWTKHVKEDLEPYTCTFDNCSKPSFKRKADWVRHENEGHRRFEGWKCICEYTSYRRDNFISHLIREHNHKKPRRFRRAMPSAMRSLRLSDVDIAADNCHFIIQTPAQDCSFCEETSMNRDKWSKHVANHMLHFSMAVVNLAEHGIETSELSERRSPAPLLETPQNHLHSTRSLPNLRRRRRSSSTRRGPLGQGLGDITPGQHMRNRNVLVRSFTQDSMTPLRMSWNLPSDLGHDQGYTYNSSSGQSQTSPASQTDSLLYSSRQATAPHRIRSMDDVCQSQSTATNATFNFVSQYGSSSLVDPTFVPSYGSYAGPSNNLGQPSQEQFTAQKDVPRTAPYRLAPNYTSQYLDSAENSTFYANHFPRLTASTQTNAPELNMTDACSAIAETFSPSCPWSDAGAPSTQWTPALSLLRSPVFNSPEDIPRAYHQFEEPWQQSPFEYASSPRVSTELPERSSNTMIPPFGFSAVTFTQPTALMPVSTQELHFLDRAPQNNLVSTNTTSWNYMPTYTQPCWPSPQAAFPLYLSNAQLMQADVAANAYTYNMNYAIQNDGAPADEVD